MHQGAKFGERVRLLRQVGQQVKEDADEELARAALPEAVAVGAGEGEKLVYHDMRLVDRSGSEGVDQVERVERAALEGGDAHRVEDDHLLPHVAAAARGDRRIPPLRVDDERRRAEEGRVGKECVRTWRSGGSADELKKT